MSGFYHDYLWLLDIYYMTSRNGERVIDIIDPVVLSFYVIITQY